MPADITREQSAEFVDSIRSVLPDCIINDRVGNGLGDYVSPEQYIPRVAPAGDFEICMTLNASWSFVRHDQSWKPAGDVIAKLAETAGKGGNFLLGVGPTAEGRIPEPAQKILGELGQWMQANGESIYGTQAGPLPQAPWGWCTARPGRLYLHVLRWPAGGGLLVPGLKSPIRSVRMLAQPNVSLPIERLGQRDWLVRVPAVAPDARNTVLVLEVDGALEVDRTWTLDPISGWTNPLGAWQFQIHGRTAKMKHLSLVERSYDHIQSWTNAEDWLSCDFRAPRPASYNVAITYSATRESAGNEFVLRVGDSELTGTVQETGGADKFQTFIIGTITVPATTAGVVSLRSSKIAAGAPLMQFHGLTFSPLDDRK